MIEPTHEKGASAYFNGDFYIISTNSGYSSYVRDPEGYEGHVALDATDEELGDAVLKAIACSRFIKPENHEEFDRFYNPARIASDYADWVSSLLEQYKYKTKHALFKNMALCNIAMIDEKMKITPMRHEKLDRWGREKNDGIEDIFIASTISVLEVGRALREAFTRCE